MYGARNMRRDQPVAIKVLPAHLSDRPELRERFEHEARRFRVRSLSVLGQAVSRGSQ